MESIPVFKMKGVSDELEVFENKLTMTPKGLLGFMTKGLQGTKTIPFSSITAIQFKKSGLVSGYIQFTLQGGKESVGGAFAAASDENSFMFAGQNELAEKIKDYIEEKIQSAKISPPTEAQGKNPADEITKLFELKEKGILSEDEFQKAKQKILGI